jgi:hypothetical protein
MKRTRYHHVVSVNVGLVIVDVNSGVIRLPFQVDLGAFGKTYRWVAWIYEGSIDRVERIWIVAFVDRMLVMV